MINPVFIIINFLFLIVEFTSAQAAISTITIINRDAIVDTLYITNISSHKLMAKIPVSQEIAHYDLELSETILTSVTTRSSSTSYLSVFTPGGSKTFLINQGKVKAINSVVDSLQNELWHSTNQFIGKVNTLQKMDSDVQDLVVYLGDSTINSRQKNVDSFIHLLTPDEHALLTFQNYARVYNFLLVNGRIFKIIDPRLKYFDFIERIDFSHPFLPTLPDVAVQALEIEFLRKQERIEHLSEFLKHFNYVVRDTFRADYLQVIYINLITENPQYWSGHQKFIDADFTVFLDNYFKLSPHKHLLNKADYSGYASLQGLPAYNFMAYDHRDSIFSLADFKGKFVLIDVWATWCGPCLNQRPRMLEIAKKFRDHQRLEVIMLSVDENKKNWLTYLGKSNQDNYGIELWINEEMKSHFNREYLVKFIPKYILIDPDGIIVHANLPEPSYALNKMLEDLIKE